MRTALIKSGVVVNVVMAGDDFAPPDDHAAVASDTACPGWTYSNGEFAAPAEPGPVSPPVPAFVSGMQARLALLAIGMLDDVEAWAINPATPQAQRIYWERASHIHRNHAMVTGIGQLLGLSDAQLDQLFIQASQIS